MKYLILIVLICTSCIENDSSGEKSIAPSSSPPESKPEQVETRKCFYTKHLELLNKDIPLLLKVIPENKDISEFELGYIFGDIIKSWPSELVMKFRENREFERLKEVKDLKQPVGEYLSSLCDD